MLTILQGKEKIDFAHSIVPIKCGEKFIPNTWKLDSIRRNSKINILTEDFEKHQKAGKTILVNKMGGWCIRTKDMDIVAYANHFTPNQN